MRFSVRVFRECLALRIPVVMENPRLMKAKLAQSGLHCSLEWVTECMAWLASEQPGLGQAQVRYRANII